MNLKKHNGHGHCIRGGFSFDDNGVFVSAQDTQHEQSSATSTANARTIRGVWRTVVTPRNCQTGGRFFLFRACLRSIRAARCRNTGSVRFQSGPAQSGPRSLAARARPARLLVRFHLLPIRRERRFPRIAESYGCLGTRSKRRRVCVELSHRSSRCQRQRDWHRLRHRRWDALRISSAASSCGTSASVSMSATAVLVRCRQLHAAFVLRRHTGRSVSASDPQRRRVDASAGGLLSLASAARSSLCWAHIGRLLCHGVACSYA